MEKNLEELQKKYDELTKAQNELGLEIKKLQALPNRNDFKSIKTLADAELVTGKKLVIQPLDKPHIIAMNILEIIIEAINPEGWKESIDWNNDSQYKWYPCFDCSGSFGFDDSYYNYALAYSGTGSWLCFSSEDRSDYAGKQFLDLYEKIIKG